MDTRITPFNGRVAHVSLRGKVDAKTFTEGTPAMVVAEVADLVSKPLNGGLLRQLVLGERMIVLDQRDGHAFVMADRDGYVGWIGTFNIEEAPCEDATHVVSAQATHQYGTPDIKSSRRSWDVSIGSRLRVVRQVGAFSEMTWPVLSALVDAEDASNCYVPTVHLRPLDRVEADPVAVAERLLHVPYLWGGNSARGIDCSGLVQLGCLMCGIPCPGDSDMQEAALGTDLPEDAPLMRGDLLFWKGHVGWMAGPDLLLHANAHHMAVAYEPLTEAINRIEAQGDGPVTSRKRLGELK